MRHFIIVQGLQKFINPNWRHFLFVKLNQSYCLRQFDEFLKKFTNSPIRFVFVLYIAAADVWNVTRNSNEAREKLVKEIQNKKIGPRTNQKVGLACLGLGRPKTLAQMPEGYAFALLIAQWNIFSEIIQ